MTTENQNDLNTVLAEIDHAEQLAKASETDQNSGGTAESIRTEATSGAEGDQLRDRARKQRLRGQRSLAKRHDGVASSLADVKLNERVVGSAFERFFPTIENGIYVISRRGEMVMGKAATEQILKQIDERISAAEKTATAELAGIRTQIEIHAKNTGWLKPTYTNPACEHEVQLRTPRSVRVVKIFETKDQIVAGMQEMAWNNETEMAQIETVEFDMKREFREIFNFINAALRGMRTKVEAVASTKPEQVPALQDAA
jgi:hypothetical protein